MSVLKRVIRVPCLSEMQHCNTSSNHLSIVNSFSAGFLRLHLPVPELEKLLPYDRFFYLLLFLFFVLFCQGFELYKHILAA